MSESAWDFAALGEITTKIGSGATPRGGSSVYVHAGTAFIRSQNVLDFDFSDSGLAFISDEAAEALKGVSVCEGDVLINITGDSVARVCRAPKIPARVSQHVAIVRPDPQLADSRFVMYSLLNPAMKARLLNTSSAGATRKALTKEHLQSLPVALPPLAEQRRIAQVLGNLDEIIEVNRALALHCSELAEALWLTAVSDSKMEKKIADCATFVLGGTPSRNEATYWGGNIPWLNSGKANDFRVIGPSEYITDLGLARSSTKMMPRGATIIAITGATLGQISRIEMSACGNQSLVGVWADEPAINDFIFFGVKNRVDVLMRSATGGAQQHVNKSNVEELELPWLTDAEIIEWHRTAGPLLNATADLLFEAEALTATRDELLPLLVSARVRVNQEMAS